MSEISRESLVTRLVGEFNYPGDGAELVAAKLQQLQPALQAAFAEWWHTGRLPLVEEGGYSVERLMAEHSMTPIAAFLTLDWLAREPQIARTALGKGHDTIAVD